MPFWVPDVLCQHLEVILWNLLSVQMFFWWICGGESGLPVLFLCHLRTTWSFRIWNSSTGIPSPPLALFVVMLPKAHLTLHSRMSGSRWMITPLLISGSWRSFLYSSVYSCHLFLISYASLRSMPFLSFIVPIIAWNAPLVSLIFLKRSLVFLILFFSSISLHWSLERLSYLSLLFFGILHSDGYIFPFILCL